MGSTRWAAAGSAAAIMLTSTSSALLLLVLICWVAAECEWKEKEITVAEGEAVRFLKKFKKVKLCLDGKLKYKPIKDVESTLACNGCSWYDEVVCNGEVVRDLYRWWFESSCSNSRMLVASRSWSEVRADPRFKP